MWKLTRLQPMRAKVVSVLVMLMMVLAITKLTVTEVEDAGCESRESLGSVWFYTCARFRC
jgi:hypothetical protein